MSDEGDTFWVSFLERVFGLILIIIGGILAYLTVTTADLGGFTVFFSVLSIILVIIGVFLLLVKPPR
jgi:hypothetical protein